MEKLYEQLGYFYCAGIIYHSCFEIYNLTLEGTVYFRALLLILVYLANVGLLLILVLLQPHFICVPIYNM